MIKFGLIFISLGLAQLSAGPFSPAANQAGTNAISKDSPIITRWASQVISYTAGADVDAQWQDTQQALGEPSGTPFDVVSLGRGGSITIGFSEPIRNSDGPDFAVFENSFSHRFLELAFVEVSSDGIHFTRFPNRSLTPSSTSEIDPTDVNGLAGKFIGGFGTPFDLSVLTGSPDLDINAITQIRIIDIAGDGLTTDSEGSAIYDPFPTFGSAGFDLDGIGVIDAPALSVVEISQGDDQAEITWALDPNQSYQLEFSSDLEMPWTPTELISSGTVYLTRQLSMSGCSGFWRISPRASEPE